MYRAALFTAASVIALCAGGASSAGPAAAPHPAKFKPFQPPDETQVLWNQNSNYDGEYINSQNYTTGYTSDSDQAADDFVIPQGKTWTITKVDVTGEYSNDGGRAMSENVIFYKDKKGMPGKTVRKGIFDNLDGGAGPNFAITLPRKGLKLKAGTYWVSVIANEIFIEYGQWYWDVNSVQHGSQAMWENPGGAFRVCYTWGTLENCAGAGPDLMFELKGTSN